MADQPLTDLVQTTNAASADLLYLVKNLGDYRITVGDLLKTTAPLDHSHDTSDIGNLFTAGLPYADGGNLTLVTGHGANAGTSVSAARADHVHPLNVSTALPQPLGAGASQGSANTYARSDHVHARPSAADIGAAPTARTVSTPAGSGLSGGGDLSSNRSLSLSVNGLTTLDENVHPVSTTLDYVPVHSNAAGGVRKLALGRLPGGTGGGSGNAWTTITAGSNTITAGISETLTFAAGSNITLSASSNPDVITIAASGSGSSGVAFGNIVVSGQNTVSADAASDTLTFVASGALQITTNQSADSVTFHVPNVTIPNGYSRVTVNGTHLDASSTTDAFALNAGTNVTLGLSGKTITVNAGQPTIPNGFANVLVNGSTTVTSDNTADTLRLDAGSNITLSPDTANNRITISSTASGGSTTLDALTDTDVSGAVNGDRIEYVSSTGRWTRVTDTTLAVPLDNFVVGNASSQAAVATPAQARAAMRDVCQVTVSRHDPNNGDTTYDLLQDVEAPFTITAVSHTAATRTAGTFVVQVNGTNVVWSGGATSLTPGAGAKVTAQSQTSVPVGADVTLVLTGADAITGLRVTLHLVRAG